MTSDKPSNSITKFEELMLELQAYKEAWSWKTYEMYKARLDELELSSIQREAAVRAIIRELGI